MYKYLIIAAIALIAFIIWRKFEKPKAAPAPTAKPKLPNIGIKEPPPGIDVPKPKPGAPSIPPKYYQPGGPGPDQPQTPV